MSPKAACVGDNCIDHYLAPVSRRLVGGNAVNVAVCLRRSGVPASYVGFVGDDQDGALILERLRQEQVDVSHVHALPGPTGITEVRLGPEGDREFVREEMGVQQGAVLDAEQLAFARNHDLVHTTILGGAIPFLESLKQGTAVLSFDYGDRHTEAILADTIQYVDIAFFSAGRSSQQDIAEFVARVHASGPRLVVVTRGPAGSLVSDGYRTCHCSAVKVKVVDTLGAGDAFIGGFLASYLRSNPLETCLQEASRLAAITCTHLGAWSQNGRAEWV